jgi:hypothetical protein
MQYEKVAPANGQIYVYIPVVNPKSHGFLILCHDTTRNPEWLYESITNKKLADITSDKRATIDIRERQEVYRSVINTYNFRRNVRSIQEE